MLRLIVNKAKHHYNLAVEHAERNRYYEAVTELKNSLDLDKNNVSTHVLLGTIFAKQKKFDEAIKEWEEALALQPNTDKAYQYIQKAKEVRKSLPVLRWVKILFGAFIVSFLFIVFLIYRIIQPNPEVILLNHAVSDYNKNHYGSALEKLETFQRKHEVSALMPLAGKLVQSINDEIQQKKNNIQQLMNSGRFAEAIRQTREFENLSPGEASQQYISSIRDYAHFSLRQAIEDGLEKFSKEGKKPSGLATNVETYAELFPEDELAEKFTMRLAQLSGRDFRKEQIELEEELERLYTEKDLKKAVTELKTFQKTHPEFSEQNNVSGMIDQLTKRMIAKDLSKVESLLEENKLDQAEEALDEITVAQLSGFSALVTRYQGLQELINDRKMQRLRKKSRDYLINLETALQQGEHDRFLELVKQQDEFFLNAEQNKQLSRMLADMQTSRAREIYRELMGGGNLLSPDQLTEEEARRIVLTYPFLAQYLPAETFRRVEDRILYNLMISHEKLGDRKLAKETYQNLQRSHPFSPVLPVAARVVSN